MNELDEWPVARLSLAPADNDPARFLAYFVAALQKVEANLGQEIEGLLRSGQLPWWQPVVVGAAVFSAVFFLVFWDGTMQNLDDKGGIALLINLAIMATLTTLQWPKFG